MRLRILILSLTVAFGGSGCVEQKRLSHEIADAKASLQRMQAENAEIETRIREAAEAYKALNGHPSLSKGMIGFEKEIQALQKEVATLTERKGILESEVAELRKDMESYCKKNP